MRGTLQTGELIGTWESWIDPQHSLFREDLRLGPIRSVSGWNGKVSWSQDQTGDVWIDDSEEALHQASLSAYVDTFAYLFPRRFPAQVTKRRGFLEVAPRGADPIAMWLDPVTHLAGRVKELTGVSRATTVFSDFRKVQDVFVPFERTETGAKPDEVHWRAKTGSVEIDRELPTGISRSSRGDAHAG